MSRPILNIIYKHLKDLLCIKTYGTWRTMLHSIVEDRLSLPDFIGKGVIPLTAPGAG